MQFSRILSITVLVTYALSALSGAAAAAPRLTLPPEPSRTAELSSPPAAAALPAPAGGSGPGIRTVHRYLGYGAVALGATAAFSSSTEGLHHKAAWGAAILGAANLATGIIKYRRAFDLGDGISRLDGHAILGGLATAGFITAIILAGSGGENGGDDDDVTLAHASVGGAALATMAVSVVVIKLKW